MTEKTASQAAEHRFTQMLSHLKQQGHRITPQRYAILDLLSASDDHPSAERMYNILVKRFPTMSLATVYKTLHLLKQQGQVLELEFSEQANRYDGKKPYPHPHLICTKCGTLIDFSMLDSEALTQKMSEETGFQITHHRLDFYGRCPLCQESKSKK